MPVSTPVPTITPRPTTAAFTKLPAVNTAKILYRPDLSKYVGQPKSSTSLDGITVFVDAGHGGYTTSITDVGATYAGVKEASVNWQVAQKVKADLEAWGAHVIMTRTADDQFRSLHYRVARVAQEVFRIHKQLVGGSDLTELERLEALFTPSLLLNTDSYSGNGRSVYKGLGARPDLRTILDIENQHKDIVFVALHCNSLPTSTKVHGLSVYWASRNAIFNDELALSKNSSVTDKYPLNPSYQFYDDTARRKFAIELRDRILALCPDLAVPDARDGQIPEGNYAVLREENVVSALVEMGYLTNAADSALLTSDEYQTKIAQGVADGIYAYYCS